MDLRLSREMRRRIEPHNITRGGNVLTSALFEHFSRHTDSFLQLLRSFYEYACQAALHIDRHVSTYSKTEG